MSSVRLDKLFHVLVILGGAAGVTACADDDTSRREIRTPDAATTDAAEGATGDAAPAPDAGEGEACFCDSNPCCDRSTDPPTLEDGFSCCWSTTCE